MGMASLLLLVRIITPLLLIQSASPLSSSLPPLPPIKSIPLPAKLAGGLFLFKTSIKKQDKELSNEILKQAQEILRRDPLIGMELGAGLEAGGVFASSSSMEGGVHQLAMEFQINGGNSWAQCRCHGFRCLMDTGNDCADASGSKKEKENEIEIVSLSVSNMDAAFNGGWAEVPLPPPSTPPSLESNEEN